METDGKPVETNGESMEIRRAIGPVACKIMSSRVVFVDPPYPPEEPRDHLSDSQGWAEPPEQVFWPPKKSSKNRPLNFQAFLACFSSF